MSKVTKFSLLSLFLLPAVSFAQTYDVSNISGLVSAISSIINTIFPVLIGIAVFVLAWGIFKFIINAADPEARKKGSATIMWGVIGIFLMLSIWGLVNILKNTFELNNTPILPPSIVP